MPILPVVQFFTLDHYRSLRIQEGSGLVVLKMPELAQNNRVEDRVKSFPAPAGLDATTHNLLLTAIHERRLLRFAYKNQLRIAEPQDYGLQKGVVHLFTYQVGGESSSGTLPDWRKFAVQNISRLELLEQKFPGSRAIPSHRHQSWDVLFARVD